MLPTGQGANSARHNAAVSNSETKKRLPGVPDAAPEKERRRIGTVVHDERGNASVRWRDAPAELTMERPPLEVLDNPGLALKPEDTHDPYSRGKPRDGLRNGPRHAARSTAGRTDLRRLSEWIKMMRELEERKRRGDDSE